MKKNLPLKMALLNRFNTQSEAAVVLGINYSMLSRLVGGWVKPNGTQRKKLERVFGRQRVKKLFQEMHSTRSG